MKFKFIYLIMLLFLFVSPWMFTLSVHNMMATGLFTIESAKDSTIFLQILIFSGLFVHGTSRLWN